MKRIVMPIAFVILFIGLTSYVLAQGCTDTDSGKNYYTKGILNSQYTDTYPPTKEDLCLNEIKSGQEVLFPPGATNENTLLEYYCQEFENGDYLVEYYNCPDGCKDGACLKTEPSCGNHKCEDPEVGLPCESQWGPKCIYCPEDCDHCVETDNGDIYTQGSVTYNWQENILDICFKDSRELSRPELYNTLSESYCAEERGINTGGAGSKTVECEFGCENGACLRTEVSYPSCVDSDSGINPEVQGTTKYLKIAKVDQCVDATRGLVRECTGKDCRLYEYYCNEGNQGLTPDQPITFNSVICPIGCKDGSCIECQGCLKDNKCYETGVVLGTEYCNKDRVFQTLKGVGANCLEDYECKINRCYNGVCRPECDGCFEENKCLPYGTRTSNQFCDIKGTMQDLKDEQIECRNSYECKSNLCVDNECIEPGIFTRIIQWFRKLFGAD